MENVLFNSAAPPAGTFPVTLLLGLRGGMEMLGPFFIEEKRYDEYLREWEQHKFSTVAGSNVAPPRTPVLRWRFWHNGIEKMFAFDARLLEGILSSLEPLTAAEVGEEEFQAGELDELT